MQFLNKYWVWGSSPLVCIYVYLCVCDEGTQKNPEFIFLKWCVYSYMFKLQSPSKYSPSDAIHLLRCFFPLLKTVFELVDFDAFQCFCCFCFTSSTLAKCFPNMEALKQKMAEALKDIKIDEFKNCFEQWKKMSHQMYCIKWRVL